MCENWFEAPTGVSVRCHRCWQCRADLVDDWVGRCTAESWASEKSLCVDLTYGRDARMGSVDHRHAHSLYYEDVQLYLKRLRRETDGGVRFFVSGEYGERRGRAHWHAILFFKKRIPADIRIRERYVHGPWPHGFSWWKEATEESMRYAAKYVLKGGLGDHEPFYRHSTMPNLGHGYFRDIALRYVDAQLPPRADYRFAGNVVDGRPKEFRLSRTALYKFLSVYDREWRLRFGNEDWPQSDLMDAYVDERARRERRRLCVSDMSYDDLLRRIELEKREERGGWLSSIGGSSELWRERGMLFPGSVSELAGGRVAT